MSFIVYSMDGCQHCELIKDLMLMAKQEHVIYTLDKDFNIKNLNLNSKQNTFHKLLQHHPNI